MIRLFKEIEGFNSKMVQLNLSSRNFLSRNESLFQFQNGSIKSVRRNRRNVLLNRVSIPKWFN